MAEDPIVNMVNDPLFQKADLATQKAALAAHDPMFAKAGDADITRFIQTHLSPNAGLAPPSSPNIQMQESPLPGLVKGAASMLPVAGGLAGAVAGAPAFGLGGMVGGGLGAAAGEAGNIAIQRGVFGEGPSTLGGQAKNVATAGALGAAAEVPGAIATSVGNRVLSRIAAAKPSTQFGDAAAGLREVSPTAVSAKGIMRDISSSYKALSNRLGGILRMSNGTVAMDDVLQGTRTNLQGMVDRAESQLPTLDSGGIDWASTTASEKAAYRLAHNAQTKFETIVQAARENSGITGDEATAEQLFSFQKQLSKPAYLGNPGPVAEVLRNTLRSTYQDSGALLRNIAPESNDVLTRLSNLHAAQEAVKAYKPGSMAAISLTSALHPRTAAVLSPAVAGTAANGVPSARNIIKGTAQEVIP